ncbi:MAG: NUDIX domain-containing protein [Dehalococcoidia bacterium]
MARGYQFGEVKLEGQYLAQFVPGDERPEGLVSMVYLILFRRDQVLVGADEAGGEDIVRGEVTPGEAPEAALDRLAQEQVGAKVERKWLVGSFRCRALSQAPVGNLGDTVYWCVYIGEAGQLLDHPTGQGRTRRFIALRDLLQIIRHRYYELSEPLLYAADQSLRLRAGGGPA